MKAMLGTAELSPADNIPFNALVGVLCTKSVSLASALLAALGVGPSSPVPPSLPEAPLVFSEPSLQPLQHAVHSGGNWRQSLGRTPLGDSSNRDATALGTSSPPLEVSLGGDDDSDLLQGVPTWLHHTAGPGTGGSDGNKENVSTGSTQVNWRTLFFSLANEQ